MHSLNRHGIEEIQNCKVSYSHQTKSAFVHEISQDMQQAWLNDELPPSAGPPADSTIRQALKTLKTVCGRTIEFANNNGKWFICMICLTFSILASRGVSNNAEHATLKAKYDEHSKDHRAARTYFESLKLFVANHGAMCCMLLLDGTPGPLFPSWIGGSQPSSMKGLYCIPLLWEIGKSYADNKTIHIFSLPWWRKGANFLITIKYHLIWVVITSLEEVGRASVFYDYFDGGTENANFTMLLFLCDSVAKKVFGYVEANRLVVSHTHNDGDAAITGPRNAAENALCFCIGDCLQAIMRATNTPPTLVFVKEIYDWTARAVGFKNVDLKYLTKPHSYKTARGHAGLVGLKYKDNVRDKHWRGGNGIENGPPVDLVVDSFPTARPQIILEIQSLSLLMFKQQ